MIPLEKQNRYRAIYQDINAGYKHSGSIYEGLVKGHLTPEARVLDAGCGRGGVIELYAEKARQAVGLDTDLTSLREHRCLKQLVVGSLATMPFPGGFFDVVLCSWVVEHLEESLFLKVGKLIDTEGPIVISEYGKYQYVRADLAYLLQKLFEFVSDEFGDGRIGIASITIGQKIPAQD